jgi:hypothetical protein
MGVRVIKLNRHLDDAQAKKMKGTFLTKSHYDILITEDTDAYDNYGNLLFRYRKNAIPYDVLKNGVDSFKGSIENTEGRGAASGSSHKRIRKDGSTSNITVGNMVQSGNVGFMDSGAMVRYCRKTAFAKKYFEKYNQGVPFVEYIDKLYKELCPTYYEKQIKIAKGTDINYRIGNTSFTTVTVNKNFRTACHQDAGDYREGFGNLIAYREGSYDGSFFVLPEYRAAVDMQNCDVLFADVHKWHGNTEMTNLSADALRISFVLYYREYMIKCKSPKQELKRIKMESGGYLKL